MITVATISNQLKFMKSFRLLNSEIGNDQNVVKEQKISR